MGHYECAKHGGMPPMVELSQSIFIKFNEGHNIGQDFHCIYVAMPSTESFKNEIYGWYVDDDDFVIIKRYINSTASQEKGLKLDDEMKIAIAREQKNEKFILIDRDKKNKELNDRLFLVKLEKRIWRVCRSCWEERLTTEGIKCCDEINI